MESKVPVRLMQKNRRALERRIEGHPGGEVRFGNHAWALFHRCIYQIIPLGAVTPRTIEEADRTIGNL